jgi:hypothetical protein
MARMREILGKDISSLVFSRNVWKSNLLASKGFTNGMLIHFNMFGALMKKGLATI